MAIIDDAEPLEDKSSRSKFKKNTTSPARDVFQLNETMQAAKDKVIAIYPNADSVFFWEYKRNGKDGFRIVDDKTKDNPTIIGEHTFYGNDWIEAAAKLKGNNE